MLDLISDWRLVKLLKTQPTAVDVRVLGRCDACPSSQGLLFYTLQELEAIREVWYFSNSEVLPQGHQRVEDGICHDLTRISGGLYCADCGFSTAGNILRSDYEQLELLTVLDLGLGA